MNNENKGFMAALDAKLDAIGDELKKKEWKVPTDLLGGVIFLAMIVFWLVAEGTGNFAIGSAVFGVLMLFFFRCKKPLYYAIVLVAAVAIWAAFRFGLGVLF